MSDQPTRVDIQKALESLVTYEEKDLQAFIQYMERIFQHTIDAANLPVEQIESPHPDIIDAMGELGFDVDPETGEVFAFNDIQYTPEILKFLTTTAILVNQFSTLYNLVGEQAFADYTVSAGMLDIRGDSQGREKVAELIKTTKTFLEFFLQIWSNYIFLKEGKIIRKGQAVNLISIWTFDNRDSVFVKLFGKVVIDYLKAIRTGTLAELSAWIYLNNNFPHLNIRQSTLEEELAGIDFVGTDAAGKIQIVFQCKALTNANMDEPPKLYKILDDFTFDYSKMADLLNLTNYTNEAGVRRAVTKLESYCSKNRVKGAIILIESNYFVKQN